MTICTANGCKSKVKAKGLCQKHYVRFLRHGHTNQTRPATWGKTEKHPYYHSWGWLKKKRGLEDVDPRWLDDFWIFVEEIGEKPEDDYRLKLVDSSKGYYKGNYVWTAPVLSKKEAETRKEYMRRYMKERRESDPTFFKDADLRRKYGIGIDEYNEMLEQQKHSCKICGGTDRHYNLAVDHDHKTGKVRALLCTNCNNGLGRFNDDIDLLKTAIEYLEKHSKYK